MCQLLFKHPPRITLARFAEILSGNHSPAAPHAAALYAVCLTHEIDPAIALAFFAHESVFGTKGVAARTLNWGNIRRGQGKALRTTGGWAWYASWVDGLDDWCSLINRVYVKNRGLTTVGAALPVYAPSSDNNRPAAYAAAVCAMVTKWSQPA